MRLDARIKTRLSAFVSSHRGGTEGVANVVDLSLSGLLLDCLATHAPGTFRLRLTLQENNGISLDGDIIRINGSQSAMQLYVPERETTAKLWQFIRDRIAVQDTCPYCDNLIKSVLDYFKDAAGICTLTTQIIWTNIWMKLFYSGLGVAWRISVSNSGTGC